jgi:hypothetical protein
LARLFRSANLVPSALENHKMTPTDPLVSARHHMLCVAATFSHQLSTTLATLFVRASDAVPHRYPPLDNQKGERILPLDLQEEPVYDRKAE